MGAAMQTLPTNSQQAQAVQAVPIPKSGVFRQVLPCCVAEQHDFGGSANTLTHSRPALNDRHLARMQFRLALFKRRGLLDSEADALADRLAQRDYEGDERRVCMECKSLQQRGGCFQHQQGRLPGAGKFFQPMPQTLQRCGRFEFQTPT